MKLAHAKEKVLIEIVANETQAVIKTHFDSAELYGQALEADQVWVVIFTVALKSEFELVWPSPDSGIHTLYVFHSSDWTQREIVLQHPQPPKPAPKRKRSKKESSKKEANEKQRAAEGTTEDGQGSKAGSRKKKAEQKEEDREEKEEEKPKKQTGRGRAAKATKETAVVRKRKRTTKEGSKKNKADEEGTAAPKRKRSKKGA